MKNINKRKRKEYNKKAYQKRKTKKADDEKAKTGDVKADENAKTDEQRGRLIKKSFTSNNKKFTLYVDDNNIDEKTPAC